MKLIRLTVIAFLFASFVCAFGAEDPVAVNVYFSKEDPHWPGVEKMVDAAGAKYPRLRVSKIDIDSPIGYKLLHALEKIDTEETGDMTVTVEHVTLTSKGERRDIETYFPAVIERVLGLAAIKGKLPVDAAAYAVEIFGKGATVTAMDKGGAGGGANVQKDYAYFRVKLNDQNAGWIVDTYHKIDCPICSDTQFLIAVKSPVLTILDMRPVRELELRGVKVDAPTTKKFLTQFNGRAASDGEKRIDALSGATKTTMAYQIAVNDVLLELQQREKQ